MMIRRHVKWIYAAAGSGIALGVFNYLQSDKKYVHSAWTVNHKPSVKWDFNWDKRDFSSIIEPAKDEDDPNEQNRINEQKKKLQPTVWRNIFLIRHGAYENSAKNDKDRKLTPLGREQADYVGKRLKELEELQLNHNFTKITSSTMTRAMETSDIILKYFPDIPKESDDLLREGRPIPPEPPIGSFQPEYKFFKDGPRIEGAFRKYFHRADPSQKSHSNEIIVCHANVIRYFLCRALQIPPEGWLNFTLYNCSITWISISPQGEVVVCAVGDFGFIPSDKTSR